MKRIAFATSLFVLGFSSDLAHAKNICIAIADARTGSVLHEEGDCRARVTPASTFKIALSVMGYDSGFLTDAHAPALPFKPGYTDWGGAEWTRTTDPTRWMKYSVVWLSQRITDALGAERIGDYLRAFDYGNADFSGDPGKDNALERAWISSSLKIAPVEQLTFLRSLINRRLPVNDRAVDMTLEIVETQATEGGWRVSGKTGSAYPRRKDGSFDRAGGWGWYVGWARKADRTVVFARLDQDERRETGSAGVRARDAFLSGWPKLAAAAVR